MGSETRQRESVIKVRCTEEEKKEIQEKAAAASRSTARYLREIGLGYRPKSTLDARSILKLVKVAGDQGRLGGLLKWWLAEGLTGAVKSQAERLIKRLDETQDQIDEIISKL